MSDYAELLERVKAAMGPDRQLSSDITSAFVSVHDRDAKDFYGVGYTITESIEQILRLIEREFPGCFWSTGRPVGATKRKRKPDNVKIPYDAFIATSDRIGEPGYSFALTEGPTPALALCAALLAAKIAQASP